MRPNRLAPVRWTVWFGFGILAIGTQYFRTIGPTYPLLGISMVVAFAFQGLGRATLPLLVMVVRVATVLLAAILSTRVFGLGEHAVFIEGRIQFERDGWFTDRQAHWVMIERDGLAWRYRPVADRAEAVEYARELGALDS